jgi:nucleotide-binding universal stress UspA family protein
MFSHLLVPLDGSHLAEAALPFACVIAEKFRSMVTLLHIIEEYPPDDIHGNTHLSAPEEAEKYLLHIKQTMLLKHPDFDQKKILIHVHGEKQENLARGIMDHSSELEPDLILFTHHGSAGLRDRTVGSIAQQVIGMGKKPTLLIHPNPANEKYKHFKHILLPIDIDPDHQASFDPIRTLGDKFKSNFILLSVVETYGTMSLEQSAAGRFLPGSTRALLDLEEERRLLQLEEIKRNRFGNLEMTQCEVLRGEPFKKIIQSSRRHAVDLIVLSSHGKAGWAAFWKGSVASRVITISNRPMMIFPV